MAAQTASTIITSRTVSCLVGQITFFSSATVPLKKLNRLFKPLHLLKSFDLSMQGMKMATRTELLKFKPVRVTPLILGGGIVPLLALGAGKMDNDSSFTLFRHKFP